jgi:hypothetical protein
MLSVVLLLSARGRSAEKIYTECFVPSVTLSIVCTECFLACAECSCHSVQLHILVVDINRLACPVQFSY